ncbi:50S ribosomal protein L15 [Candidatus Bathyarchaeota archaeon]|nr:MAG: 50S ribosomal protein L15 [Candidatus Bathyarchaeota archaeon]RLI32845.1 MAG: 50S ribosomal protein L15 [Candidatus Bathyarchaeota archaeon]
MPHKLRKIRKLRGSRTCGYGRVGQHRKSGGRGGVGKAGGHKHFWSYVVKYDPLRFRRIGFKPPSSIYKRPTTINVGELKDLVMKKVGAEKLAALREPIAVDLEEMGFGKLLGRGRISIPVVVKVPSYTERALRKIEEAGGRIVESLE